MKPSVLMSIKAVYGAMIMNFIKEWEVRKHPVPIGTLVYMYITSSGLKLIQPFEHDAFPTDQASNYYVAHNKFLDEDIILNGKVIGSFIVDKIRRIKWESRFDCCLGLCKFQIEGTRLSTKQIVKYMNGKDCYLWHVSHLKIFEQPKYLTDFKYPCEKKGVCGSCKYSNIIKKLKNEVICDRTVYKAPQSYCYVEERYGN